MKTEIVGELTQERCTLTDLGLIERLDDWNSDLCKTGGKAWTLSIPVNFDNDPDMLISELIRRFKEAKGITK